MPAVPANLAVFISGGGRSLLNLHEHIQRGTLPARIALVVASRECPGAARGRALGLPVRVIEGEIPVEQVRALFADFSIDFAVLAGYLTLLPIPPAFRARVVNIHPALLPKFGGPGMYGHRVHEAVLASGERTSGCTVHLCDDRYDAGPIILQRICPVLPGDTPDTLADRVFTLEREAYPEALRLLIAGRAPAASQLPPVNADRAGSRA